MKRLQEAAAHFEPKPPKSAGIMAPVPAEIAAIVEKYIKENKVMLFSKSYCPYCKQVIVWFWVGMVLVVRCEKLYVSINWRNRNGQMMGLNP